MDIRTTTDPGRGRAADPSRRAGLLAFTLALLLSGCVFVPGFEWRRAEENRMHINTIRPGQTIDEVRAAMGKPPEKREVRARFDGKTVEMWSYVTDYGRRLDTTITFVDGVVEEVRAVPWENDD